MSVTTHLNRRTALHVLVSLAMVLLVVMLQMAQPSKAQNQFAPSFKVVGEMGKPVEMREGTLTLTRVRVAKSLEITGLGEEKLETTGYWLLVDYKFVQERESESMNVELYTDDNTRYTASNRPGASAANASIYAEPGFRTTGLIPYEVPKDALAGSRLVVGNGGLFGLPLWDHQAVVPLDIDQARANQLVESAPESIVLGR